MNNSSDRPYVLNLANETLSLAPESKDEMIPGSELFTLVQKLDEAMRAYLEVKQVLAEAQLTEQKCLEKIDVIQKAIDDWYVGKHLTSPVGSHWGRTQ